MINRYTNYNKKLLKVEQKIQISQKCVKKWNTVILYNNRTHNTAKCGEYLNFYFFILCAPKIGDELYVARSTRYG